MNVQIVKKTILWAEVCDKLSKKLTSRLYLVSRESDSAGFVQNKAVSTLLHT